MDSPQLTADEQIVWVVPCRDRYITISQQAKFGFVAGELSEAFCMAREADANALFRLLSKTHPTLGVSSPERRIVPSHPSPPESDD